MSSALVRQALEFVDKEECGSNKRRKNNKPKGATGQDHRQLYKQKGKRVQEKSESKLSVEEKVSRLLALSAPTTNKDITDKIVERAARGRPVQDKLPDKKEKGKSILFPEEETFKQFEEELFCS